MGAVIWGFRIPRCVNGHLFSEQILSCGGRGQLVATKIGVIEAKIMVILHPVGPATAEKADETREAELFMPLLSQLWNRLGGGVFWKIIINNIARPDEEIRIQLLHGSKSSSTPLG